MLLIQNGRVVGFGAQEPSRRDIFINKGKIAPLSDMPKDLRDVTVLDAAGCIVAPGLVDMHVHLRDPGQTDKEDLLSGALAAAAGGVTTVACMPNTSPVIDTADSVRDIVLRAKKAAVNILPYAAVTVGQKGTALSDFAAVKAAGACALSDDGVPVMNAAVLRRAMLEAKNNGLFISSHCEDADLVKNYAVNDGAVSRRLGMPGRPAVAESLMAARDVMLAHETGSRLHIAHVSAAETVHIIRRAKALGISVTAETCPQYFTLTEDEVLRQGALARVNPPLRTETDIEAVIEGLCDGTLDAIATDHAPHLSAEKARPLPDAPSGMVGLETSLALSLTALCHTGRMSVGTLIRLMSENPAKILGLSKGRLDVGSCADVVIFDPDEAWTVDSGRFYSKSRNTPFNGMSVKGRVKYTLVAGEIVFKETDHVI
ncbi:dihydroorotase [Oscillospiraceae bacterium CM]|nr:dihydroorotase [Oscillospiraceae bacterium CM]